MRKAWIVCCIICLTSLQASAAVWYVNKANPTPGAGTSWATAFTTIQAAIGGKIIAREDIPAFRKDVTAGLYGGDVTRKNKLLGKQKKGKKRMKSVGNIEIPTDTFIKLLRN